MTAGYSEIVLAVLTGSLLAVLPLVAIWLWRKAVR